MKLHILSDLHTEFADFSPPETGADIVVLAGDIGVGLGGIEWATRQFPKAPVIYVPGNHEFYDHDIGLTDELKASVPANIHVLNDDKLELDGIRFLGCTLWTDSRHHAPPPGINLRSETIRKRFIESCIRQPTGRCDREVSARIVGSRAYPCSLRLRVI